MTRTIIDMWYNQKDGRLDAAVRKLGKKNDRLYKLQRALHPWWVTYWVLVPVIATGGSVYVVLAYQLWQPLAAMLFIWGGYYAVIGLWLGITNLLRFRHLHRLHRDYFGAAIMWSVDAEWLAMQSALQVHGLMMKQHLANSAIAADLTEYLMMSRHARLRLRAAKQRPMPGHPDMQDLQKWADHFAALIATRLNRG